MDPLLKQLKVSGLGLSVNKFFACGFLHIDDIKTLATSIDSLNAQVALVKEFAENNFLKLNVQKCEVVVFDRGQRCDVLPECEIDSSVLPVGMRENVWAKVEGRPSCLTCCGREHSEGQESLLSLWKHWGFSVPCQQGR